MRFNGISEQQNPRFSPRVSGLQSLMLTSYVSLLDLGGTRVSSAIPQKGARQAIKGQCRDRPHHHLCSEDKCTTPRGHLWWEPFRNMVGHLGVSSDLA